MIVLNNVTQVKGAMNNQIPLEYVTSFADANQAMMQQLTSALLTSGNSGADFSRFAEVASVQQNYLAEMSALWVNALCLPQPRRKRLTNRIGALPAINGNRAPTIIF